MALVSLRGYARHRGVTLQAVQKAIAAGRISVAKTEKVGKSTRIFVDPAVADKQWEENTDPKQQRIATRGERADAGKATPIGGVSKNATGGSGQMYSKARGLKETYGAMLARLEYEQKANKLVSLQLVKNRMQQIGSQIVQNCLSIPPRICSVIAAEYQTAVDVLIKRISAGGAVTIEDLSVLARSTVDSKKAHDIIEIELKKALLSISEGKFL